MDFPTFATMVEELTRETGPLIASAYRDPGLDVDRKADDSPVTWADREAERVLRKRIGARYPDHGMIGEEWGADRPDAEWVWILDPIDGTRAFTAGCPLFGTLIGITQRGMPRFGAIHLPLLGDLYVGDRRQALRNGSPVQTRSEVPLEEAVFVFTDPVSPGLASPVRREGFDRLLRSVGTARTWGDCFGYTLLASGQADIALDPIMHPWDVLPLIPVVEGAGGIITDWEGGDAAVGSSAVATGSEGMHRRVLALLAGTAR